MANIAKLPSGSGLMATATQPTSGRPYGPHCVAAVIPGDSASLYSNAGQHLLTLHSNAPLHTSLGSLDPITMPYANRFLSGTSDVLIKDWRTGNYRVKSSSRRGSKAARASKHTPTAFVPADQPKAAVITVAPAEHPAPIGAVSTTVTDPIPGMFYPKGKGKMKGAGRGWLNVDGVVVPTTDFDTMSRGWALRQKGQLGHVVITGPAGTAKTLFVRAFASAMGVPFLKVDCSAVRTADDWSGAFRQDPNTKTWAHQWSPFARALRAGQPCIILLDELTRTESPAALNALLGLLDETGTLLVSDANTVLTMPSGIMVVATANIGPEFVGTLPLDGAVRQRFWSGVRLNYPTEAIEAKLLMDRAGIDQPTADALVRMAVQQRLHRDDAQLYPSGNVVSTRMLLGMANTIGHENAKPRDAVWSVLKGQFDPADDAALTVIVDAQFPKTEPKAPPSAGTPASITTDSHWFSTYPGGVGQGSMCDFVLSDGTTCNRVVADPIHLTP